MGAADLLITSPGSTTQRAGGFLREGMMTRQKAMARLRTLLGPRTFLDERPEAATATERQAARAQLGALKETEAALREAWQARRAELLRDPEYQRLVTEHKLAKQALNAAHSTMRSYRLTAGVYDGLGLEVTAQADNYAQLVDVVVEATKAGGGK